MVTKAYSKINLRLKVLGKTTNNYHLLQMVNAKTCLYDSIKFKKTKQSKIIVKQKALASSENTIFKVLNLMFEKYHLSGGIIVTVKKRIPYSAGLAGGSVDAAATIKAINYLYSLNLSLDAMKKIALCIGTDTVYALHDDICLVEGIGEQITPLNYSLNEDILIINPNIELSTKEIYSLYPSSEYSAPTKKEELEQLSLAKMLENDLEKVVLIKYPVVFQLKTHLQSITKLPVLMSGSGPSIYIIGELKELKAISKKIKKKYPKYKRYLTKIKGVLYGRESKNNGI